MTKSWYNIDRYYTSADSRPTKEDKFLREYTAVRKEKLYSSLSK